jgi:hypothetical protein
MALPLTLKEKVLIDSIEFSKFRLQSEDMTEAEGIVEDVQMGQSEEQIQTLEFVDNEGGVLVTRSLSDNVVAVVDNTDDISLGEFLSRPTLIDTTTWAIADLVGQKTSFQPWYQFLNNTIIKKKIDNYAFMRGRLHVKIILNATPFQFGAMRVCYCPLLGFMANKIATDITAVPLIGYSQQPGFWIYPQANSGGEIVLPFLLHKNWLDITSATEVQNMGTLTFQIFAGLQAAIASATTNVTIRTYAWMTDVHLMGSTLNLSLQSGKGKKGNDEYGKGPVSRPASVLASIASSLTHIPVIGAYARATEIGANAVSSVATMFGYTNTPVIDPVHGFQPMNAPMLASAHIGSAVQKLTLDPKQELCIDPAPHGIGSADELSISALKVKESYVATATWSTAQGTGTNIFACRVRPNLMGQVAFGGAVGKKVYHTPLSYMGEMFAHWRGGLIFRIKVVCSKYHKGRLKLSYDPRNNISSNNADENAVYTKIIDIGEEDDIEIHIPYHQAEAWLQSDNTLQDNFTNTAASLPPSVGIDNGTWTLRILTGLSAPSSSIIGLLIFVRAADTFEFANPRTKIGKTVPSFFALQSENRLAVKFRLQAEDLTSVVPTRYDVGPPTKVIPERYDLNFGEVVGSLRNLLHRSMTMDVVRNDSNTIVTLNRYTKLMKAFKRMPYVPGYDVNNAVTFANRPIAGSGTAAYNFIQMHHIPYITSMFVGYRGSVNYAVTVSSDNYSFVDDMKVARSTDVPNLIGYKRTLAAFSELYLATISSNFNFLNRDPNADGEGLAGLGITSNRTNASLTFNFPDYNNYNFGFADPANYFAGSAVDGTYNQNATFQALLKGSGTTGVSNNLDTVTVSTAAGAGPDFTCLFFLCCPTLYYFVSSTQPIPV